MDQIIYSKISVQRDARYRIMTQIMKRGHKKIVRKRAVSAAACHHLKAMLESYPAICSVFAHTDLEVVKGRCIQPDTIEFPFIDGMSFENLLEEYLASGRQKEAVFAIKKFWGQFLFHKQAKAFEVSDAFTDIFGASGFWQDDLSLPVTNIDSIFSNFIVCGEKLVMIDYEWVFYCPVPIRFVIYRSILHSSAFGKLDPAYQAELYAFAGIDKSRLPFYLSSEEKFQSYVRGEQTSLDLLIQNMHTRLFKLSDMDPGRFYNGYQVLFDGQLVKKESTVDRQIQISVQIPPAVKDIRIRLNDCNGVYKIQGLFVQKEKQKVQTELFESNAQLVIINDYFFTDIPEITIKNQEYEAVYLDYRIIEKDSSCMELMITALKEADYYKQAYHDLEKERHESRAAWLWKLGKKIRDFRWGK